MKEEEIWKYIDKISNVKDSILKEHCCELNTKQIHSMPIRLYSLHRRHQKDDYLGITLTHI